MQPCVVAGSGKVRGEVAEKPILFSGEMVKAILDGRKTMTRRVVNPQFTALWGQGIRTGHEDAYSIHVNIMADDGSWKWLKCPYGKPGDLLWVRETWVQWDDGLTYLADSIGKNGRENEDSKRCRLDYGVKWRPSIFMPRWASRITLRITGARVERLQAISEADMMAEGITHDPQIATWLKFASLWNSINEGRGYGWDANPWVWVVSFEKL